MHLGIIGLGNIGVSLMGLLDGGPVTQVTALVRPGSEAAARDRLGRLTTGVEAHLVTKPEVLVASRPDVVAECAGHGVVRSIVPDLLAEGIDVIIVSLGALADRELERSLLRVTAGKDAGRMIFPIGAIGGLDLLSTLAPAGSLEVGYKGKKPPAAWQGSPAENIVDLSAISDATAFFEGTAREAAVRFPKNANVVAALALAGAGFDETRVELVADPKATGNTHAYQVMSPICRYEIEVAALPSPDNPRTSATTAWSVLEEIRRYALAMK